MASRKLPTLLARARACTLCAPHLPHPPRPVLRLAAGARVAIIGQAPGAKVHASGVPWQDASGDHLREWLGVDASTFEDPAAFAILPMGLCWPGRGAGGDLPPRPECAPTWHEPLLAELGELQLTLLVGQYAQARYLGDRAKATLTDTVRAFASYLPAYLPLPHPSWRSKLWMAKHPWFAKELLPELRGRVAAALRGRLIRAPAARGP
ncbi:MAG: uracil-DNA glycosylase family protein [Kofleriaceae bacterium]